MAKQRHKTPVSVFVLLLQLCLAVVRVIAQVPSPKLDRDARGMYSSAIANITGFISDEARREASFCIVDPIDDWNKAFNYKNYSFVASCMTNQEDFAQRLCSAAEIKFYLNNIVKQTTHFKPSRNCNLSSWPDGCEPGWACSTGLRDSDPSFDLTAQQIPSRSTKCKPCCEGFFCPQGLTCMIPCPLGAYCPRATYNDSTGLCDPYSYRLPAGRPSHTCGGANIWADIGTTEDIFCPAGSYCPTTTEKNGCHDGHYCLTGSTNENRCSKLISCKANTESQNIRTYGIMLIIALIALLFLIYNCSGQMLHIRDRRHARSRERAVRSVQESERARAKWKAAKNAAKKHASQLHVNFSRKFSRQRHEEEIVILEDMDLEVDGSFRSPPSPIRSKESTLEVEGSLEGSSNLAARVRAPEDESHSSEGSTSEIERKSKSTTKRRPKAKANTNTMIFEYAYSEIEKEKSREEQNKNITFSRVISMATNSRSGRRPSIEIAFKDLTLTLKGKKKLLLRSLNGQIVPGRITSVMGPSGAGKTTFLSALAGKATGCRRSGSILINGRPDPIHSYKKIIGFVPQDDIVHGNLTVEENLWFSARCRLSTTLSEADKVLIVERVIENLGLQEVRDSLVGTVEKRGISGGQRKRVNVGLEMVMEPSLLFLDEPTSGLDSSSSRLLLRALRHEAHAGVNICMVVHQPSYALFQMFDDLILLAKGGFMVYHGSIRKVEEYFRGLRIDVPPRVNPPDYYIDILEGLVEPSKNPGLNYKELPLRWMLHNGYSVPPDMHSSAAGLTVSTSNSSSISDAAPEELSFGGELWSDVRCNIELQRDQLHHTFLRQKDFSNRRTPNIFIQYKYFLGRISKQRLRESRLQATDYLILLIAGACLGAIAKISDASFGAFDYSYTVIAISLLCQIAALRTFMIDKLQCQRERSSGISSLAHFLAKDTVDHFNTLIKPVVYLSMYYFFTNPRSTFLDNYTVLVCLVYCVTGMGYAFAIFFDPGPAQLFSVLIPVCLTLLSSQSFSNESLKGIATLCYPKWVLEAFVIANAKRYYGVWLMTRCGVLMKLGFDLHNWGRCLIIVFLFGAVSRIIAFIAMLTVQKT